MAKEVTSTILNIEPIDFTNLGFTKETLKGEVAVVTGGASNVGLGYARALAWVGAKVVVTDINETSGKEAERVINEENEADCALFVKCDITQEADVKNLAQKAFEKFGKVDLLINNAMNMRLNGLILGSSVDDLDQSYAISGRGVMLAIKEFVPAMIERKHGVVTYSSTQFHLHLPLVGGSIYCAGKSVATSVIMSLANEVKDTGVNVFCLAPAGVGRRDPSTPSTLPDWVPKREERFRAYTPGFFNYGYPPEASGAALVYCILNSKALHGSGIVLQDVFEAMNYPYPDPDKVVNRPKGERLIDMDLTRVFLMMGPGFTGLPE